MQVAGPSNTIRFVHLTWKKGIWVYMVIFVCYQSFIIIVIPSWSNIVDVLVGVGNKYIQGRKRLL
jgi:hypothetical protein